MQACADTSHGQAQVSAARWLATGTGELCVRTCGQGAVIVIQLDERERERVRALFGVPSLVSYL